MFISLKYLYLKEKKRKRARSHVPPPGLEPPAPTAQNASDGGQVRGHSRD